MSHSRKELIEKYIRAAWILKIRLMSARRHLWTGEASLIHIETAGLQIRKICETIAYLCVIASEIEFDEITSNLRTNYRVGEVLNRLARDSKLLFPHYARLEPGENQGDHNSWNLKIQSVKEDDVIKLKRIHDRTGNIMHEFSPYRDFPDSVTAPQVLWADLNGIRADHKWLWNQFWHHANYLKGKLFFINLADQSESTCPTIIKVEGFLDEEIEIDFDPNYVSDFTGVIDWAQYQSHE